MEKYKGEGTVFSGKKIRKIREQKGDTRQQVASNANVSPETIAGWENGSKQPGKPEVMNNTAKALGCSIQDICNIHLNLNPLPKEIELTEEEMNIMREAIKDKKL